MVKALTTLTLVSFLYVLGTSAAPAPGAAGNAGAAQEDALEKRTTSASGWYSGQTDPWIKFTSFNWDTWIGYGWQGHTLAYVKEWYYYK